MTYAGRHVDQTLQRVGRRKAHGYSCMWVNCLFESTFPGLYTVHNVRVLVLVFVGTLKAHTAGK